MKNDYSFNDTEKLKRNWLVQIMSKYPKYELSYFSMLTDESPENRKYALIHFLTDMKDRGIKVLYRNSFERFTKNDRYNYTQQFINLYNEDDQNDEVIFADPNTGFYSTDVSSVKESKHIDMEMIRMLLEAISDNSVIYCFQYNQNNTYTGGIEEGIESYIVENNLNTDFEYDEFVSAKPQLKLYRFTKKLINP